MSDKRKAVTSQVKLHVWALQMQILAGGGTNLHECVQLLSQGRIVSYQDGFTLCVNTCTACSPSHLPILCGIQNAVWAIHPNVVMPEIAYISVYTASAEFGTRQYFLSFHFEWAFGVAGMLQPCQTSNKTRPASIQVCCIMKQQVHGHWLPQQGAAHVT